MFANPVFDRSDLAVGYGGRGIQSIGHAIRLAGRTAFVKWIALAFAAARANSSGVDNEIARQAVQRARMCEAVGERDAVTRCSIELVRLAMC